MKTVFQARCSFDETCWSGVAILHFPGTPGVTHHNQKNLFCHEGYQSVLAAANLQLLGLVLATDMEGGFCSWRSAGLPTKPYDLEEDA